MPYLNNLTPIRLYESTKKKHFQDRLKIVREQNQNCSRTIQEEFANNFLSVLWSVKSGDSSFIESLEMKCIYAPVFIYLWISVVEGLYA